LLNVAFAVQNVQMDAIDRRLLGLMPELTRPSILELARRAGVARGTVQARIDRLIERGVIAGFGPRLDLQALGYTVTAFVSLEISQGKGSVLVDALRAMPEVLEVHKTTGAGDLLVRMVARTNEHLHELLEAVLSFDGVERTQTSLVLHTSVQRGPDSVVVS
jgi:DNA-binding Lrp family transcriptional regulator